MLRHYLILQFTSLIILNQSLYLTCILFILGPDNEGWSEKKFDNYWENGGEDKEIDEYIAMTVDNYDEESNWKDLEGVE